MFVRVVAVSLLVATSVHAQVTGPPPPKGLVIHPDATDSDFAKAVQGVEGLRFLTMRGAKRVGGRGFGKLGKATSLEQLVCLQGKISDKLLKRLKPLRKLKVLNLRGCSRISNRAMNSLRFLPAMVELDVVDTAMTGPGIKMMAGLKYLRTLRCGSAKWKERDLEVLAWLPQLTSLELHGEGIGDGSGLRSLAKLTKLKHLAIGTGEVGPALYQHVMKIEGLHIVGSGRLSPEALGKLDTLSELRTLTLTGADAAMIGLIKPPSQIHTIKIITSPQFDDPALAKLVEMFPKLQHLDLSGAEKLTADGLEGMGNKLRQLTTLTVALANARGADLSSFGKRLRKLTLIGDAKRVPSPERQVGATIDYVDVHTLAHGGGTTKVRLLTVLPRSIPRRQRIHQIICEPAPHKIMNDGVDYADFHIMSPARNQQIKVTFRAEVFQYDLEHAMRYRKPDVPLTKEERKRFTSPSKHIDSADAGVVALAAKGKAKGNNTVSLIKQLHELVCRRMEQGNRPGSIGAANALKAGNGDCTEYADLFAALCRARGLPARVVTGGLLDPKATSIRHSWVEVYTKQYGWVPYDPIFNDQEGAKSSSIKIMRLYEQFRRIDKNMTNTGKTLNYWSTTVAAKYSEALSYKAAAIE